MGFPLGRRSVDWKQLTESKDSLWLFKLISCSDCKRKCTQKAVCDTKLAIGKSIIVRDRTLWKIKVQYITDTTSSSTESIISLLTPWLLRLMRFVVVVVLFFAFCCQQCPLMGYMQDSLALICSIASLSKVSGTAAVAGIPWVLHLNSSLS